LTQHEIGVYHAFEEKALKAAADKCEAQNSGVAGEMRQNLLLIFKSIKIDFDLRLFNKVRCEV